MKIIIMYMGRKRDKKNTRKLYTNERERETKGVCVYVCVVSKVIKRK
jgi:hypothetical protein